MEQKFLTLVDVLKVAPTCFFWSKKILSCPEGQVITYHFMGICYYKIINASIG